MFEFWKSASAPIVAHSLGNADSSSKILNQMGIQGFFFFWSDILFLECSLLTVVWSLHQRSLTFHSSPFVSQVDFLLSPMHSGIQIPMKAAVLIFSHFDLCSFKFHLCYTPDSKRKKKSIAIVTIILNIHEMVTGCLKMIDLVRRLGPLSNHTSICETDELNQEAVSWHFRPETNAWQKVKLNDHFRWGKFYPHGEINF